MYNIYIGYVRMYTCHIIYKHSGKIHTLTCEFNWGNRVIPLFVHVTHLLGHMMDE